MNVSAPKKTRKSGFTLLELLVAMGITSVLILVMVGMTSVAIDAWRASRDDIRGSKLGRTALETVGRDFQSLVRRRGNDNEWLFAQVEPELTGPSGAEIPNAAQIIFFASPTDRYDGDIVNNLGDVAAISYRLVYRDPILDQDPGGGLDDLSTFTMYRQVVNPDEAFQDLYQVENLQSAYQGAYEARELNANNFVVENIYEFTLTFIVEHDEVEGDGRTVTHRDYVPISVGPGGGGRSVELLRVRGDTIETIPPNPEIEQGRIVGATVSVTVLTDEGLSLIRRGAIDQRALFERYSYRYAQSVITPGT